jgi:tripartite-type tricarboxylate transporter receptor subunit TctC
VSGLTAEKICSAVAGCVAVLLACASACAAQQSPEQFYKGKTITLLIGHPPGGSYDLYARLAIAHMSKYIPGHPTIRLQSRPGSGGVPAVAWFYANAPKDGSMMALLPDSIAHMQLLQPEIGKWRVQEMTYLGSFTNVNGALVIRKGAPAKSIDEMRNTQSILGCTGKLSNAYMAPMLLNTFGGFKFKVVCGYPGSSDVVLAMARGELDGYMGTWNQWSLRPEIKSGEFLPVAQFGMRRHKDIPDVPLMQELFTSPKHKHLMDFVSSDAGIGRALLVPSAVPADRLAALRGAFDQVVKDPAFIADAAKRGAELDPTSGGDVQRISEAIVNTPQDIIQMSIDGLK